MTRLPIMSMFVIGILAAFGSQPVVAQTPTSLQGLIGGAGVAVIKRQPEMIRMYFDLTATGKDLKDALSNLKTRREAAVKICADLSAAADSVTVGAPHIAPDMAQRQRMMSSFPSSRSARGKKAEAAPPVNVAERLTAEWPLTGSGAEELLLSSQSLRDKLKSELVKSMPKPELSPEQEELQEEAAQQMANDGSGAKPGDPAFVFVAKVSQADYVKAAAKAFNMAKAHAQRLADAAGISLGELRNIEGNDRQAMAMMNYPRQYFGQGMQEDDSPEQDSNPDEAIGANPAEVRLNITIAAYFALGK